MGAESLRLAHMIDCLCVGVVIVLPILAVLRWNLSGVILGVLIAWGSPLVAGALISDIAPGSRGDAHGMLDAVWLLFGWIFGLLYCLLIYGMKRLVLFVIRLRISKPTYSRTADIQ